jgi:hypothetical protein
MNPKQTLETAAYNYLTGLETPLTLIESTSIYKGTRNPISVEDEENTTEPSTQVHPSVTLEAEGEHSEAVQFTGNYQGVLAVTVTADGNVKTDAEFGLICDEVFSKFDIVELETNFSSRTSDFYMYQARVLGLSDSIGNGQNWQKTLRLMCVYAEADL